jgi:alkanesulfonate monooxygenase SsuD/methylene tetrahydromethanopterin reductase-like flavin-dependent oxidoreductase (luciferase family)
MVEATYQRVARAGDGYVGASVPAAMVAPSFDGVRKAWNDAGREGEPRLIAIAYYAFGDVDQGRANVHDYYSIAGADAADFISGAVSAGPDGVRATLKAFEDIGADELIFNPTTDDPAEITRLAEIVL